MEMLKHLKNKNGDAVRAVYISFFIIIVSLLVIQIVTLYTSAYILRQKSNHSLALLEASITEDIYESLTEKNFDLYSQIVDETGTGLNAKYSDLFNEIFQRNLKITDNGEQYIGSYFAIDKNSINLTVTKIDNDNIRFTLSFNASYHLSIVGFDNADFDLVNEKVKVFSDYNYHGQIEGDDSDIKENTSQYDDRRV